MNKSKKYTGTSTVVLTLVYLGRNTPRILASLFNKKITRMVQCSHVIIHRFKASSLTHLLRSSPIIFSITQYFKHSFYTNHVQYAKEGHPDWLVGWSKIRLTYHGSNNP